jgi:cell division protein FtsN
LRCRVTLPEVKPNNGVYVYPEPLKCIPIPFDEKASKAPATEPVVKTPQKSDAAVLWEAFKPETEKEYNRVASLFVAVADQMPRPTPQAPQVLIAKSSIPSQGGPFVASTPPSAQDTVDAQITPSWSAGAPMSGPVTVQVGSYGSEAKAKEAHAILSKKFRELAGKTYSIVKADLGAKGTYYRLRVGSFASKREAAAFCDTLSAKGQSCYPVLAKAPK